ncbi:MAG: RNase adapter RapZ [Gammaproteobacteria bacterium]|nr:MAG: RNase adapter RapZ [Gammaproteobacteria bacterium]
MNLIIVSGLSGSGKTIALQALEDAGYYCIDNLPAALLPHVVSQIESAESSEDEEPATAVGVDIRNRLFLDALPTTLKQLKTEGIPYRIIFLEADDTVLVKRYKESRRRHPMMDANTSLLEGIGLERKSLGPLSVNASLRIDTTHTTPQVLRNKILDFINVGIDTEITLHFESFGFKHGTPIDADYVFDVRCLPNPYWQPELRQYTGKDDAIISFMQSHEQVAIMATDIENFLRRWTDAFINSQRNYITIAIGCTGGQHRSVYLAELLGQRLQGKGIVTQVRHRELP